ncbi:hypothetical protein A3D78_06620 [Candidatus Gottesmanbacteria bacterium RIFCSPHIGHO2_02_FULL_39_14]|uniref:AbiEi antitoxin C-terminal domain-containing protein n=1 Tax=Candidatus Gottesmanbacteria bacterium RIFCSPHIGHO2_02_FULL_39_14 TaxID=1798383 RepID=A0A1F5ZXS5_9BACT|nr:MAG: hypothetical protein A3D78_06620 [Candidatus Gottesmanbacteria bacterium RIFCSPHIGHO2_02_FULL_39_14]
MESYSSTDIMKILKEKELSYFSISDFGRLFNISNQNTLYKKIERLEKNGIIKKLIKGKYLFLFAPGNDFVTANFLYQPSYISLETALSFYGIITGFPYRITSITAKKTRHIIIGQKEYTYSHIDRDLYWGYEKKDEFVIAEKEKALLDFLYFCNKGLRNLNADELDISELNEKRLIVYAKRFKQSKLLSLIGKIL